MRAAATVPVVLVLLFFAVGVLAIALRVLRSRLLLRRWATFEGLRILERKRQLLPMGPFAKELFGHAVVYRVVVADREGQRRSGWVRCGRFWGGLLSSDVEVAWEVRPTLTGDGARRGPWAGLAT